jgi:hypothetical protein
VATFQQNLPQGRSFQPACGFASTRTLGLFPEISGNRLVASVRLMTID